MTDIKTIMSWLEGLAEPDWRMYHSDSEVQNIAKETLVLLQEQEAVKPNNMGKLGPHPYDIFLTGYCPKCGTVLLNTENAIACGKCGQALKWE